jgi:hypothetical protein
MTIASRFILMSGLGGVLSEGKLSWNQRAGVGCEGEMVARMRAWRRQERGLLVRWRRG